MLSSVRAMPSNAMSDMGPTERVHTAGRDDLAAYRTLIATSTASRHSPAIEALVQVAIGKYRRMHEAYVAYLAGKDRSGGGEPGSERRSPRWREAAEGWAAAQECLAAAFGVLYPKSDRHLPLAEVQALVERRLGPLCTGWHDQHGALVHHPHQPCDVHHDKDTTS